MVEIIFSLLILVSGLIVLWWAGDLAVKYALELSDIIGISSFTAGFIILSVSTGLPEITTAVISALNDVAGISAGDIIGSTLVNLSLVLGVSVIAAEQFLLKDDFEKTLLRILAMITVLTSVILYSSQLFLWHGILLLSAYLGSVYYFSKGDLLKKLVKEEKEEAKTEEAEEVFLKGTFGTSTKFLVSLGLVILGARLTVSSVMTIGSTLQIPLESLGATFVAVGTGLPEISLSLNSVRRKEYALAIGNIFGSSLVNMTLILGLLSVMSPGPLNVIPLLGTMSYLSLVISFLWFVILGDNSGFEKKHGITLLIIFGFYLVEEIGVINILYLLH